MEGVPNWTLASFYARSDHNDQEHRYFHEVDQGDFVMILVEIIINSNRGYVITH